jgi:hypothetical protein
MTIIIRQLQFDIMEIESDFSVIIENETLSLLSRNMNDQVSLGSDEEERLRSEISEVEKELNDILQLNYDIVVENRNKDYTINNLNEFLKKIIDRNESELEQLSLEDVIYAEEMDLEILIEEQKLKNLRSEMEKLEYLESQNLQIKSKIVSTSSILSKQTWNYSETIHGINKNIRDYREELEQTMRKELLRINNRYQNAAYASLDKSKKKSLLKLTMLRDEITLQDFGKSSLALRYLKQEQEYRDCSVEYSRTHSMLESDKEALSGLYSTRRYLEELVERAAMLEQYILSCREEFTTILQQKHQDSDNIYGKLQDCLNQIRLKEELLTKWRCRAEGLRDLQSIFHGDGENGIGIDACVQSWNDNLSTDNLNTTILTTLKQIFKIPDLYQLFISITGSDRYNHLLEAIDDEIHRDESNNTSVSKLPIRQDNLLKDVLFDSTILWAIFHIITIWECKTVDIKAKMDERNQSEQNELFLPETNGEASSDFKKKCLQWSQSIRKDLTGIYSNHV